MITKTDFKRIYTEAVQQSLKYWTPEIQKEISLHNIGWSPEKTNTKEYLECSWTRYWKVVETLIESNKKSVCDIGGFWGAFPIALKELGFQVSMTEALKYYSDSFTPLFDHIRSNGVVIHDYDPFEEKPTLQQFDAVTVMAVLEHYPHSLSFFMDNIKSLMNEKGLLFIDVPNIAYFSKRVSFLLGKTPLVPIENIYRSRIPFIGHHHEYTLSELENLARLSNMKIVKTECFNYSPSRLFSLRSSILHPVRTIVFALVPTTREVLMITLEKQHTIVNS